jgi:lipopolysaccharide/colanic/teichoic acid biosynthesis glycosyltransferase
MFEAMMKIGRRQRVEFRFAPSLFELLPQKTSVDQIGVLPMVRLFREPLSDAERFVKRLSDIVISVAALTVTAPLLAAIAIWIKLDSKGSVFFHQERVGMDGRVFLCYKFRSMHADADEQVHREAYERNIAGDVSANTGDDDAPVYGKVKNDLRLTRAGRLLRRTSLDELPQMFNVLFGDMSVVGPRPPIPYEVEAYEPWQRKRLDMKPGITGLWQVSGRNRLTFEEMVRTDLYYIVSGKRESCEARVRLGPRGKRIAGTLQVTRGVLDPVHAVISRRNRHQCIELHGIVFEHLQSISRSTFVKRLVVNRGISINEGPEQRVRRL